MMGAQCHHAGHSNTGDDFAYVPRGRLICILGWAPFYLDAATFLVTDLRVCNARTLSARLLGCFLRA